jgi:hypothetical protein
MPYVGSKYIDVISTDDIKKLSNQTVDIKSLRFL